ncbi:hypothetical protein [Neobacillus sp. LXY-4]|uniref:hypothetical protein n=1 Tax=Neobacillus sp. LXY-4 TaxID=3379826 RepID=UPI003EE1ABFC
MDTNKRTYSLAKRKEEKESLEISSTGYGLESVSNSIEEDRSTQSTNDDNPSCGGL